jgi:GTP-binding protein
MSPADQMKIASAEFVKSIVRAADGPRDGLPQVAFVGRSNVGKSSLLNTLLGRRGLAKTSSTPGKTRTINFFLVDRAFYCVDLPGYGYAKVSKAEQQAWRDRIEGYLLNTPSLRGVVLLLDSRHAPTPLDQQMWAWLAHHRLPVIVALTKSDKLARGAVHQTLTRVRRELALTEATPAIPFSATTGEGRVPLWLAITHLVEHS